MAPPRPRRRRERPPSLDGARARRRAPRRQTSSAHSDRRRSGDAIASSHTGARTAPRGERRGRHIPSRPSQARRGGCMRGLLPASFSEYTSWMSEEVASALRDAERGDFTRLQQLRPEHTAWIACFDAMQWLAGITGITVPSEQDLAGCTDITAREAARAACGQIAKIYWLRFDAVGLARTLAIHETLLDAPKSDDPQWQLTSQWLQLARGQPTDELEPHERTAVAQRRADLVIDIAATRALAADANGDLGNALRLARRASRM